jgi:hypothetical protein
MAHDLAVAAPDRELDRVERLGQRADLVRLDQNRIRDDAIEGTNEPSISRDEIRVASFTPVAGSLKARNNHRIRRFVFAARTREMPEWQLHWLFHSRHVRQLTWIGCSDRRLVKRPSAPDRRFFEENPNVALHTV